MKNIKKLSALILAVILIICITGCHKKDEIAVKVGGTDFTSAEYMCSLIYADMQARTKAQSQITSSASTSGTTSKSVNTDIYSQKIDGKEYTKWVKDTALTTLKTNAYYIKKCKELKLELSDTDKTGASQLASNYWKNYSSLFEDNGVSEKTHSNFLLHSIYSDVYFKHIYGEGGEKEISSEKLAEKLAESFAVADIIEADFSSLSDADKTLKRTQFDGFVAALNNGSKTFKDVYAEYYGSEPQETTSTDGSLPQDSLAQLLGSEDTSYASEYFSDVKSMNSGEAKIIEKSGDSGIVLVLKKDISADPYYLKTLDVTLRTLIVGDDFNKESEAEADKLDCTVNKSATDRFKVKKIKYPETTS